MPRAEDFMKNHSTCNLAITNFYSFVVKLCLSLCIQIQCLLFYKASAIKTKRFLTLCSVYFNHRIKEVTIDLKHIPYQSNCLAMVSKVKMVVANVVWGEKHVAFNRLPTHRRIHTTVEGIFRSCFLVLQYKNCNEN